MKNVTYGSPPVMPGATAPAPGFLEVNSTIAATSPAASSSNGFHWTPAKVVLSLVLFVVAGVAEIGGGWLVWQAVREGRPWWFAFPCGACVLIAYGFIPTAQPTADFGRIYAVYGGFFILLSYFWGWAVDGVRPDLGAPCSPAQAPASLGLCSLLRFLSPSLCLVTLLDAKAALVLKDSWCPAAPSLHKARACADGLS